MTFNRPQQRNNNNHEREEADGQISLWTPESRKGYVISGKVNVEGKEFRVFIYEARDKKESTLPDYYGYLYEVEEVSEEKMPYPKATKANFKKQQDLPDDIGF